VQLTRNRSSRHVAPFWTRHGNSTPAEAKEVRKQIESKSEASKYRELNLRALRGRHDRLVETISRCTADDPCAQILCSQCARRYRLWLSSEVTHLATHGPTAFTTTILLKAVPGSALSTIVPGVFNAWVRKRLTRADVPAAIGGMEASYRAEEDRWIVHLHLLVFDDEEQGPRRLRAAFHDADLDRPVVCKRLCNFVAQISYLQKFQTYHRPGQPGFGGRGRAYPMKPDQIDQLARWTKNSRFEDFLFVLGLRRRGSRFDHEIGFKQALADGQQRGRDDGGDGGDGPNRHPRNASAASAPTMSSVTSPKKKSDRLYRDPDSKRAIREDRSRASANAIPRARSPTVATKLGPHKSPRSR
jgi:hypothetical protein